MDSKMIENKKISIQKRDDRSVKVTLTTIKTQEKVLFLSDFLSDIEILNKKKHEHLENIKNIEDRIAEILDQINQVKEMGITE